MWWLTAKTSQRIVQWPKGVGSHTTESLQEHATALARASHWTQRVGEFTTPPSSQPSITNKDPPLAKGNEHTQPHLAAFVAFSSLSSILLMPTCSKPITWSLIVFIWSSLTASIWLPSELIYTVIAVSETLGRRQMNTTQPSQGHRQDLLTRTLTHANRRHCVSNTGRSSLERQMKPLC